MKREIPVAVVPLNEALETYLPPGQFIDFMNVDIEGHDLEALRSNDWRRFRPRFIVVEYKSIDPEKSEIVHFMRSCGYYVCVQNVIHPGEVERIHLCRPNKLKLKLSAFIHREDARARTINAI